MKGDKRGGKRADIVEATCEAAEVVALGVCLRDVYKVR